MQKILILATNPKDTGGLRLGEELRDIDEGLKLAKHRDQFELCPKHAVRSRDVRRALLKEMPQIVHFSGYGSAAGLIFEDEQGCSQPVSQGSLASLLELFADPDEFEQPIRCVVLCGCYSPEQAAAIAQHIPFVIGLGPTSDNQRRIEFAVALYDALGAGRSVEFAFKFASAAYAMTGSPGDSAAPMLVKGVPVPAVRRSSSDQLPVDLVNVAAINWEKGKATKLLRNAIVAVYPTRTDLVMFLEDELDKKLNEISDAGNLTGDAFALIKTARAQGWLDRLYEVFCECNSDNSKISTFQQQLLTLD